MLLNIQFVVHLCFTVLIVCQLIYFSWLYVYDLVLQAIVRNQEEYSTSIAAHPDNVARNVCQDVISCEYMYSYTTVCLNDSCKVYENSKLYLLILYKASFWFVIQLALLELMYKSMYCPLFIAMKSNMLPGK